jgi:hypothetical protein
MKAVSTFSSSSNISYQTSNTERKTYLDGFAILPDVSNQHETKYAIRVCVLDLINPEESVLGHRYIHNCCP